MATNHVVCGCEYDCFYFDCSVVMHAMAWESSEVGCDYILLILFSVHTIYAMARKPFGVWL